MTTTNAIPTAPAARFIDEAGPWFPRAEFESRLERVRSMMLAEDVAGVLLFEPETVAYLTGFYTFGYTSSFQAALVLPSGDPVVIVRHTEAYYLDRTSPFRARHVWFDGQRPADVVADAVRACGLADARLGVEMRSWMLNAALFADLRDRLPETAFVDLSHGLTVLRLVKSPAEMAYIDVAARIAEAAMEAAVAACFPGATENDVAAAVFATTTRLGADRPDICIASGEAADHVHGLYTGRALQPGDVVAVEVVPSVRHYHARFMRSICLPPVDPEAEALARRLLKVQDRALAAVGPGVAAAVPDSIYREGILAANVVDTYANKTFYSVGLMLDPNTAEPLDADATSTWAFQAGMVFHTYLAVKGLTFSETVAVTPDGCTTGHPLPPATAHGRLAVVPFIGGRRSPADVGFRGRVSAHGTLAMEGNVADYRSRSLWFDGLEGALDPRPPLPAGTDVDVAIVGAGYTGLWTAYYLKKADPGLRVVVLEREIAGYGGSGRNGGWCHTYFPGSRERALKRHGKQAVVDQQRALFDTVYEIQRVVAEEDIDARFHLDGVLNVATSPVQLMRAAQEIDYHRSWGFGDDYALLGATEANARMQVSGCLGAVFCRHGAALDPARLARGLAAAVEKLGVPIYEQTPVTAIAPHAAETPYGTVKAEVVVRATEAFTPDLPGYERHVVPIYSLMIATEPLDEATWERLGWSGHEVFADLRHLIFYAMHTNDGRIAIGGRGAPYHYNSKVSEDYTRNAKVQDGLRALIRSLFPQIGTFQVTHHWGGAIAASRDWYSSVGLDRTTGLAWAGAYVGDGVSTTNLAGRTLSDLIRGEDTALTRLPWVNHASPQWEPEPFRWIGVNLALRMMASADKVEEKKGRPSRRAELVSRMIGA